MGDNAAPNLHQSYTHFPKVWVYSKLRPFSPLPYHSGWPFCHILWWYHQNMLLLLLFSKANNRIALQSFFPFNKYQYYLTLLTLIYLFSITPITRAMRLVVQRVQSASVTVNHHQQQQVVSTIGPGLVALVGLHHTDDATDVDYCARKLVACKLWANAAGTPWRQSVQQKGLDILLVSQFTLYGRLTKKNQPDYQDAMKAVPAAALYQQFVEQVRQRHTTGAVQDGVFGAMMDVALVNDGPVTIIIDSPSKESVLLEEEMATTASVTTTEDGTTSSETA